MADFVRPPSTLSAQATTFITKLYAAGPGATLKVGPETSAVVAWMVQHGVAEAHRASDRDEFVLRLPRNVSGR